MPLTKIIQSLCKPMNPISTGIEPKLKELRGIRAVVFDVYGTLFISAAGDISIAQASTQESIMRSVFEAEGFSLNGSAKNICELFLDHLRSHKDIKKSQGIEYPEVDICEVWQDFVDELLAYEVIEGTVSALVIKKLAIQYECRANPVWPMPRVIQTLESLLDKEASLALISNAQFYTPMLFSALLENTPSDLGISEECSVWSYKEGHGKPSTELFERSVQKFMEEENTPPESILYVGNDMLNDILPAGKVGFKTALFAGDKRSLRLREDHPLCPKIKPDLIITALEQLPECIQG